MKAVIFFARITFIYNLCMLVTFMMRYFNFIAEGNLKSTIVVAGYVLAVFCNAIMALWCLALVIRGERLIFFQPRWMFIFNSLCLIFQIYLLVR